MLHRRLVFLLLVLVMGHNSWAQHATISGIVRDEDRKPLDQVVVTDEQNSSATGTHTNSKGFYIGSAFAFYYL